MLDLKDLLQGDSHTGHDAGNLTSFLHFEKSGSHTIPHVSRTGAYSGGFDSAQDNQVINLTAVDLVGSFTTDTQIINDLLTRGKLITD